MNTAAETVERAGDRPDVASAAWPSWGAYAPGAVLRQILHISQPLTRTWLNKQIVYPLLRGVGRMLLGPRPADVTRLGARLRLAARGNVCEGRILFNPGLFDPRERQFLSDHLPESPIFIDAGANIGGYTFHVCQARPKARVIAVEASPTTFAKLAFNAAQNPKLDITPVHLALADKAGTVRLFVHPSNTGGASMHAERATQRSVDVPAVSLLELVQSLQLPRIDALKIDIEGVEDVVLKPFFDAAPAHLYPKLVLIEKSTHLWRVNLLELFAARGYVTARDFGMNVALELKPSA